MVRVSNTVLGCLNFLTFLISVPIFAIGIWLLTRGGSECEKLMNGRAVALGAFLMVVSLAGFIGACFKVNWLMWFYLVVMLLVILLHVGSIIFDLVVTAKGGSSGEAVAGRGYKEYHLQDYSPWFRATVDGGWRKTRSCLVDGEACKRLQESNETYTQFISEDLSPIESGCCKPPSECGFLYHKPTVWAEPPKGFNSTNPDCKTWSNENTALCFDCDSCKAGIIAELKGAWRKSAIAEAFLVAVLIVVYAIGCCALRNNREDDGLPKLRG